MKARFRVQHQILSGMKYIQVVSRMVVKNKMQEMIVSGALWRAVCLWVQADLCLCAGILLPQYD